MTKNQYNVLTALKGFPPAYRVGQRAGGTIALKYVDAYDGRTVNSLLRNGWIAYNAHGVVITNRGLLARRVYEASAQ